MWIMACSQWGSKFFWSASSFSIIYKECSQLKVLFLLILFRFAFALASGNQHAAICADCSVFFWFYIKIPSVCFSTLPIFFFSTFPDIQTSSHTQTKSNCILNEIGPHDLILNVTKWVQRSHCSWCLRAVPISQWLSWTDEWQWTRMFKADNLSMSKSLADISLCLSKYFWSCRRSGTVGSFLYI